MANKKVSQLTAGGAVQDTDLFYAERGASQVSILGSAIGGSQPLIGSVELTAADIYDLADGDAIVLVDGATGQTILPNQILYLYTPGTDPFSPGTTFAWQWGDDGFGTAGDTTVSVDMSTLVANLALHAPFIDVDNHNGDPADIVGQPLKIVAGVPAFKAGAVLTVTIPDGGSGYAVGDTGTLTTATGTGFTYEVDTVGAGFPPGDILTLTITNGGSGYFTNTSGSLVNGGSQPGAGAGAQVGVTSTDESDSADGTLTVFVYGIVVGDLA